MRKEIISLLMLIVMVVCGACTPSSDDKAYRDKNVPLKTIYLVAHSWHAGIVVRKSDIPDSVWPQHKDFKSLEYLEVGWGDNDFYQTLDPHLGLTIKAALFPTTSVLHIVGFNESVPAYFPSSEIIEIEINYPGFERLCQFIEKSYALDDIGSTIMLGGGLYGESRFYQSRDVYHLCKTCNVWTAKALQAAGLPINPMFAVTVGNLMSRVSKFGNVIRSNAGRR